MQRSYAGTYSIFRGQNDLKDWDSYVFDILNENDNAETAQKKFNYLFTW
jgi:hypothetical protein